MTQEMRLKLMVFDVPVCDDCGLECPNVYWDMADLVLCAKCWFERQDKDIKD